MLFCFQFIGIITFLLGACNELVTSSHTKKSKKKTNQSPDELQTSKLLNNLNETVQNSITFLEDLFEAWPKSDFAGTLEQELAKLSIEDKYQCPVEQKLKNGLQEMVNDVRNILKKKSKYLKTLVQ